MGCKAVRDEGHCATRSCARKPFSYPSYLWRLYLRTGNGRRREQFFRVTPENAGVCVPLRDTLCRKFPLFAPDQRKVTALRTDMELPIGDGGDSATCVSIQHPVLSVRMWTDILDPETD